MPFWSVSEDGTRFLGGFIQADIQWNCNFLTAIFSAIAIPTLIALKHQDKGVAQSILENFGFHNEYDGKYEKMFTIFWILQANFCDSTHFEWLLGFYSKKVAAVCHK